MTREGAALAVSPIPKTCDRCDAPPTHVVVVVLLDEDTAIHKAACDEHLDAVRNEADSLLKATGLVAEDEPTDPNPTLN